MKSYSISKISTTAQIWQLPSKLAEDLGLEKGDCAELYFGSLSAQVKVIPGSGEAMGISEDIINHLKLPLQSNLGLKPIDSAKYRLGPIVGILTFPRVIAQRDLNRYIPYALSIKNRGLLFVFGPHGINAEAKTISGFYFDNQRKVWLEREFPFPDAVMDRIYPNSLKAQAKLEAVIGPNRIFNKKTLINKIKFFTVLSRDGFLKNYIPETRLFQSAADLADMLQKNPGVFLKPVNGMKGKGIVQVTGSNENLLCRSMSKEGVKVQTIKEPSGIYEVLQRAKKQQRRYVIQAEIPRMKFKNRPFEFRVMAVKNGSGEWSVPAIFVKIAEPDGFLTNISSGGKIMFFKDLMKNIENRLPFSKTEFIALLSDLSVKTAGILDQHYGPLGKLGLDVIVDTYGKPWLVEANGNPGLMPRAALVEYPQWRSQMYAYPIAYCLFLAGFSDTKL